MQPGSTAHWGATLPQPGGMAHRVRSRQGSREHADIDLQAIMRMDLVQLQEHCRIESERFFHGQPHDTRFAYELFRRALVECCEASWEYLFNHYRGLVERWIRRSGAFASTGESSEFFVSSAFARFWQAISPERFASFPTLASLLHYLQLCAACVVIDSVRAQSWAEMVSVESTCGWEQACDTPPDEEVIDRVAREEFWRQINALLAGDTERFVVYHSFVMGRKPGEIYQLRRDLFSSVADVYNVKRNVLGRLSRNQELRRMAGL